MTVATSGYFLLFRSAVAQSNDNPALRRDDPPTDPALERAAIVLRLMYIIDMKDLQSDVDKLLVRSSQMMRPQKRVLPACGCRCGLSRAACLFIFAVPGTCSPESHTRNAWNRCAGRKGRNALRMCAGGHAGVHG